MTIRHQPDPEFQNRLEWQLRSELRRLKKNSPGLARRRRELERQLNPLVEETGATRDALQQETADADDLRFLRFQLAQIEAELRPARPEVEILEAAR